MAISMKKLLLVIAGMIMLSACSSGTKDVEPVEKKTNLHQICVQERITPLNYSSSQIVEFISKSLEKKNLKATKFSGRLPKECTYFLTYNLKGKRDVIISGQVIVREQNTLGEKNVLGKVVYKNRGDEREWAKKHGIQGQFDKIIGQLFQNY